MPSTPTTSLRLELQQTGEALNQWGERLNQALQMVEQAVCGVLIKPLTGNVTLQVQNYVSDEARNATLVFTAGSGLAAAPTVTIPAAAKSWHVDNRCGYPITFTNGGTTVTVPVGRQADVFSDGANLFMLEPIAAASAVTQAFADQAAVSAQTAMTSASTATTRRDQALAARDETYAARDTTLAYRDTTLGYRNAAAVSAQNAANSAAGVNLPAVGVADAGKVLTVKTDGSGYEPKTIDVPAIKPITMTAPTAGATNLGSGGTYTFVVQAFSGDTTGFYSDYGIPLATRFVRAYEPGGTTPVVVFTVTGSGVSFPVNFTGSGLAVSHTYEFQAGYTDAQGNTVLSQRVSATTAAQFKPGIGQAYEGGFLAYERFGDGNLFDLVTAAKSTEASKVYASGGSATALQGAFSRVNGLGNTTLLNTNSGGPTTFAAGYAASISIGGTPGYDPAIDEARAISFKLRPANAPVAAFQTGGSEAFTAGPHWSSTEYSASGAAQAVMTDGTEVPSGPAKTNSALVRAIKRIQLTPPYAIGTAMEGGYLAAYFTDLSSGTPVTYMLIVADKATEVTRAYSSESVSSASRTGRTNGASITQQNATTSYPAILYADGLVSGGKDDWYLGAVDEMLAIARMNASLPSAQRLNTTGTTGYWSSTEIDASNAKVAAADSLNEVSQSKSTSTYLVRAIRRVALT